MFKNILKRLGVFDKGTRVKQIGREAFTYKKLDGHSVNVCVFWVTGSEDDIDRVFVKYYIDHWSEPNKKEIISDSDQKKILKTFHDYFAASGEIMIVDKRPNPWKKP